MARPGLPCRSVAARCRSCASADLEALSRPLFALEVKIGAASRKRPAPAGATRNAPRALIDIAFVGRQDDGTLTLSRTELLSFAVGDGGGARRSATRRRGASGNKIGAAFRPGNAAAASRSILAGRMVHHLAAQFFLDCFNHFPQRISHRLRGGGDYDMHLLKVTEVIGRTV
jgi:hypothetical protein